MGQREVSRPVTGKRVQPALVVQGGPRVPPKHIKVSGHKIHLRLVQQVVWGFVLSSLAVAVVASAYYLITQKGFFFPKSSWDNLFTQDWWTVYRHGIRNVGEGVLAAMAVHTFVASWKKHPDERLSGIALAVRSVATLIGAFALIIIGIWLLNYGGPYVWHHFFHHQKLTASAPGWVGAVTSSVSLGSFVLGFAVTHAARTLWRPVGSTINLALIEGAVYRAHGRTPAWVRLPLAPPAVRERFSWVQETEPDLKPSGDLVTRILTVLVLLCVPLAIYGEYILHVIAKGK